MAKRNGLNASAFSLFPKNKWQKGVTANKIIKQRQPCAATVCSGNRVQRFYLLSLTQTYTLQYAEHLRCSSCIYEVVIRTVVVYIQYVLQYSAVQYSIVRIFSAKLQYIQYGFFQLNCSFLYFIYTLHALNSTVRFFLPYSTKKTVQLFSLLKRSVSYILVV